MTMKKKKKKICYINPGINIRRPISFIMNLLNKNDYEISILTPRKKTNRKRENTRHYDDFTNIKLITYPVWTNSSGFIWPIPMNLEFYKNCWKVLRENDVVHIWTPFYPNTFIICLLKLLFFKKKTLILTMDTFPAYSFRVSPVFDSFFKLFFKTVGKIAFYSANYVSIYGQSFIKYARKAGVPKRKIIVTPTGIIPVPKPPDIDIREKFNIDSTQKIVLFVGLHNKRKGIDLIIKTARLLKNEDIVFILVGDGPERLSSINKVSKMGLSKKFVFTGNRLDVHNFYNQVDLFFLPSRGEGLAGVLMEAMVYRVPIITSNIAGTRDLINNLENGLLCETENYRCYAKSIRKILTNKDLQQKFKQKGIERINTKFLWEKNIQKFERIYDS